MWRSARPARPILIWYLHSQAVCPTACCLPACLLSLCPRCYLSPVPQVGDSLAEFLVDATPDAKLRQLMMSMAEASRTIAHKVSE